jgi:hypothetical protein
MLRMIKVSGNSLEPRYREGDFVLAARIPFLLKRLEPGDAVVLRHPYFGTLIKLVDTIATDGRSLRVVGLHPESVDSREFGPVPLEWLVGKVIWHWKRPR